MTTPRRAAYPGSFNPPTLAHIAVAEAVRSQRDVDRVSFVISRVALAKQQVEHPQFEHRLVVLEQLAEAHDWLDVEVTEAQLLVDIAAGYDVLVMGADKWHQINDPIWYNNNSVARDAAIAGLPTLAIAPRPPQSVPDDDLLLIDHEHATTSSTKARAGDIELMVPVAQQFALETGAWIDQPRYDSWLLGTAVSLM